MTGRAAYLRSARVTVWTPRPDPTTRLGAFFGAVVPNALVIEDPLRIEWQVQKDGKSQPNRATIKVNNLAESSRAELGTLPKRLLLEVGYRGQLRRLASGDVTYASHEKDGPTWTTTIVVGDGSRAYRFAEVNRAMAAGTTALEAVRQVAAAMGLELPAAVEARTDLRRQFTSGLSIVGRAAAEMSRLLAPFGLAWSIQDGELAILDEVSTRPGDALVLDEAAGLIGSPAMAPPAKPGARPVMSARCLLYPELAHGRLLQVRSLTVNGRFRVESVTHTGCNRDGDAVTELEAKAL